MPYAYWPFLHAGVAIAIGTYAILNVAQNKPAIAAVEAFLSGGNAMAAVFWLCLFHVFGWPQK